MSAGPRARWRRICDRIVDRWRDERAAGGDHDDTTNLAYLTDPRWHGVAPGDLRALMTLIAKPFATAVAAITGRVPLFHNTQFFPEPRHRSWPGEWHRDCQFIHGFPGEATIRAACDAVHLRVALVDDDHLEFAPGSHARDDTAEESVTRRESRHEPLHTARRYAMRAGDGLLFHAWGVHRGRYVAGTPRRTLDIIYSLDRGCPGTPADGFPAPAPLTGLDPAATAFHRRSRRRNPPP